MRSQRRSKQPWSRESLRRALEHHKTKGTVGGWSEPDGRGLWCVQLRHGDPVDLTEAQVYGLCCGLASATAMHDAFLGNLASTVDAVSESLCNAATGFTCSEAQWLADLLASIGRDDIAQHFIDSHARGDEWGDEHYRGACGACGQILEPGEAHDCDLDPRNERTGALVLEATEVFEHPSIAEQLPDVNDFAPVHVAEGWPGEIVGS